MAQPREIKNLDSKAGLLRTVVLLTGAIIAVPLIILSIIYALSLKHDVVKLADINQRLLDQVSQQRQLMQQQRQITSQQLEMNKDLLSVAKQQLEVSQNVLQIAQSSDGKLSISLATQQQLLGVAQMTLQQAQDINRKMPPPTSVNSIGL